MRKELCGILARAVGAFVRLRVAGGEMGNRRVEVRDMQDWRGLGMMSLMGGKWMLWLALRFMFVERGGVGRMVGGCLFRLWLLLLRMSGKLGM